MDDRSVDSPKVVRKRRQPAGGRGGRSPETPDRDAPSPSWMDGLEGRAGARLGEDGRPGSDRAYVDLGGAVSDEMEAGVERIREEARKMARADGDAGMPAEDAEGPTESELDLRDRCSALFERWHSKERRKYHHAVADREERIAERLGKAALGIDRFERLTHELIRLKARFELRRREVTEELASEGQTRGRGIPTPLYLSALAFLGLVEFFANAPVFTALLPRDPLSERQIHLLSELSTGWFAGMERVMAHVLFRPDAALLALGVITFLCVLAHFFGHALRDLVIQGERKERRHTVHSRSVRENVVPLVLSAVGLVLTLGVLYEARVTLGEVGEERYVYDMEQVEELRRQAGWLRVDGELMEANALLNRAEDTEAAATELREYSVSMARMNFSVLLLNLTLVLCAISAAYFHRRDARTEHFNETPFEDDRRHFVEKGEACALETSELLAAAGKDVRALKSLTLRGPADESRSVVHQLESVFATYRAENARLRGLDPRAITSFRAPLKLDVESGRNGDGQVTARAPEAYEEERAELAERFKDLRQRFTKEAASVW